MRIQSVAPEIATGERKGGVDVKFTTVDTMYFGCRVLIVENENDQETGVTGDGLYFIRDNQCASNPEERTEHRPTSTLTAKNLVANMYDNR
jgi:hypothetical protein